MDEQNFEFLHYFTQALRAHLLYQNDVDYVVKDGQVQVTLHARERARHALLGVELLHELVLVDAVLLKHFKSLKRLREATVEEVAAVVGAKRAQALKQALQSK